MDDQSDYERVAAAIRASLDELAPGTPLNPNQLAERFATSLSTVDRALRALYTPGVVEYDGRHGRYVTAGGPHVTRTSHQRLVAERERMVAAIRASLAELPPGKRPPTIKELADQYETTPSMVEQALEWLAVAEWRVISRDGDQGDGLATAGDWPRQNPT